jgi:hypothetical protein
MIYLIYEHVCLRLILVPVVFFFFLVGSSFLQNMIICEHAGAFVGCSLEGSIVTTRTRENSRFYGSQSLTALDILLGSLPRPPAAAILYRSLADLYQKLEGVIGWG